MNRHTPPGLDMGCPYAAVGMQRALASAIGLPRRPTSASWMLGLLMPADVRRSFMLPLLGDSVALLDAPISERQSDPRPGNHMPIRHSRPRSSARHHPWSLAPRRV